MIVLGLFFVDYFTYDSGGLECLLGDSLTVAYVNKYIWVFTQVAHQWKIIWCYGQHVDFQSLIVQGLLFVKGETHAVFEISNSAFIEPKVLATDISEALHYPTLERLTLSCDESSIFEIHAYSLIRIIALHGYRILLQWYNWNRVTQLFLQHVTALPSVA